MELCGSCHAAVEPGRSHCRVCDTPVRPPEDPTLVAPTTGFAPPGGSPPVTPSHPHPQPLPAPPPADGTSTHGQAPYGHAPHAPAPDAPPGHALPPPPGYGQPYSQPYEPRPVYAQPVYPPPAYAQPVYAVPTFAVPVPVAAPPKSKAAAALLCFFLGGLGIHRFYTGQAGLGVALLLTSLILGPLTLGLWYVVTFVWILVDFVLILSGGVRDQYGRPLT